MSGRDRALATATVGWPVFPVRLTEEGAKRPLLRGWRTEATTLAPVIRAWWERWPEALVGVPTGEPTGLYVLDVDGPEGAREVRRLLNLPAGWLAGRGVGERGREAWYATPSRRAGGEHWLFSGGGPCRSSAGRLAPGLDVRGEGGFVVAWEPYPPAEELPALPAAVRRATVVAGRGRPADGPAVGPVSLAAACVGVRAAPEGRRNELLNRWAWATAPRVLAGLTPEAEWRAALVAASSEAGYPEDEAHEVLDCVLDAKRREVGRAG